ncbi:hypothetical protein ACHHYP_06833, partial [Achlya hypogyna]
TTTLSGSGTESFSALSTASLVASTINCANCATPQSFLSSQCSKCATPAKSAAVKLKVLCARLTTAKKRGIDIRAPCFVCSSPNDPTTDVCGECQFTTPASDDDRLRLLVAILDHDRGADEPKSWNRPLSLVNTAVLCPVCKSSHMVTDAECPSCATPALPANVKLGGLLRRIEMSGAAIDTMFVCQVCDTAGPITQDTCRVCDEKPTAAAKVKCLCSRINLIATQVA